jgi:hypothetical protein
LWSWPWNHWGKARLFDAATVLIVALGVGCLYVALLVATLAPRGSWSPASCSA